MRFMKLRLPQHVCCHASRIMRPVGPIVLAVVLFGCGSSTTSGSTTSGPGGAGGGSGSAGSSGAGGAGGAGGEPCTRFNEPCAGGSLCCQVNCNGGLACIDPEPGGGCALLGCPPPLPQTACGNASCDRVSEICIEG